MTKRNTKTCPACGSEVSLSNFEKHYMSKKCLSGGKQVKSSSLTCSHCESSFSSSAGRGVHEVQCGHNSKRRILNLGRTAWNKGLKSKPDTRNPEFIGKIGGYRPNAGRSQKFKVVDSYGKSTTLQSTYELKCMELLNDLGIKWSRPKALKYDNKNYFADFYLVDFDLYLDPKNSYKAKLDTDKIAAVIAENKVKLYVLLKEQLTRDYIENLIAVRPNGEVAS